LDFCPGPTFVRKGGLAKELMKIKPAKESEERAAEAQ